MNTTNETLQSWQKVWRDGFAPQLSDAALEALAAGLERDDGRILQGATCSPPPMLLVADWPVEGACAIGFACWHGDGKATVGEVEESFARACHLADELLNEPGACRYYLNWFDETPRDRMRPALLAEVRREQARRATA